jgi:hypothetical protein
MGQIRRMVSLHRPALLRRITADGLGSSVFSLLPRSQLPSRPVSCSAATITTSNKPTLSVISSRPATLFPSVSLYLCKHVVCAKLPSCHCRRHAPQIDQHDHEPRVHRQDCAPLRLLHPPSHCQHLPCRKSHTTNRLGLT